MYNNYDYFFSNVIPHYRGNIKIFDNNDEPPIERIQDSIPEEKHEIWNHLFYKLPSPLNQYAYGDFILEMAQLELELIIDERGLGPQLISTRKMIAIK